MAGDAAATLIGLLFVAVSVGTGLSTSSIVHGTRGFLKPALVYFGTVLFQALALLAPWPSAWPIGLILGLGGLAGVAYEIHIIPARYQYQFGLALRDWYAQFLWVGVPALGNASLIVGAVGLIVQKTFAPYSIAGAITLLLFAGI
jgi:hypothetical protein